jgi:hypothetical protein
MHEAAQFATAPTHANTSHCCVIDWVWYARVLPRMTGAAWMRECIEVLRFEGASGFAAKCYKATIN